MKYHRCNACQRFAPLVQPVCDCGARFDGTELQYKACPACGLILPLYRLRCDCGYLFIFRSFLDRQATPQDISGKLEAAYQEGRRAALLEDSGPRGAAFREGMEAEAARADAQWEEIFLQTTAGKPAETLGGLSRKSLGDAWDKGYQLAKKELSAQLQDISEQLRAAKSDIARNDALWETLFSQITITDPYQETRLRTRADYCRYLEKFEAERRDCSGSDGGERRS